MAFTNSPTNSTYSTKRLPLAYPLRLRQGNQNWAADEPYQVQDEGMVNLFPIRIEGNGDVLFGQTRPGLNGSYVNNSSETDIVRGMYVWEKSLGTTYYFVVVGTKVYTTTAGPGIGTNWTQVNTLLTSDTSPVRFTEFIDATNVKKLILVDGVEGYVYTTNLAGTKITDADFPSPHVPFPVFLNGRLYLAKTGTGDIYNSNLNDPALWTAGDFISTEVYPDDVQALIKIDNYIVAVGINGCEYFYDAANALASPLARYEGGILPFGCIFPNSIAFNKDTFTMLANTNDGQSLFISVEGFKVSRIDSCGIVSAYNRMLNNPNVGFEIVASACRGNYIQQAGVRYYTFLLDGVRDAEYRTSNYNMCYAFSFDTKAWTELQWGSSPTDRTARYAFPIQASASNSTGVLSTYVAGNIGDNNVAYVAELDDLIGFDFLFGLFSTGFYQELRTPNLDFETLNRKFMSRIAYDIECGDSTLQPLFSVSWNDADFNYDYWSTPIVFPGQNGPTTMDYFPIITQLGMFRRRALKFFTNNGKQMTARYFDVDINKGKA